MALAVGAVQSFAAVPVKPEATSSEIADARRVLEAGIILLHVDLPLLPPQLAPVTGLPANPR